jgi:hypothetical protein
MKAVGYGLIAFFCLGTLWGIAHIVLPSAPDGTSVPGFRAAPSADQGGGGYGRYMPILR